MSEARGANRSRGPSRRAGKHRHRRSRTHAGALAAAPWVRAPLLLLRQPVVFLALVGAAAILAIAAASGPLFLSTIGTASLDAQAQHSCPEDAQPTVTATVAGAQVRDAAAQGTRAFARHGLSNAYYTADGYTYVGSSLVHLFSSKDALTQVTKLTRDTGAHGVWLPSAFASGLGAKPGDTITTRDGVTLPVAGIYRDLAPNPFALSNLPRYWCSYTNQIVSTVASDGAVAATPPNMRQGAWLITDDATVARAAQQSVQLTFSAPMSTKTNALSAFDAASARAAAAANDLTYPMAGPDPLLGQLSAIAHTSRAGVAGSVVPIEVAGVIVAALLIGGAGMFWATARQREIRLLVARGVGPLPLAGKAILETIVPMIIGAAAGLVATSYLVKAVGPSRALDSGAPTQAALVVAATLLLAILIIGAIGATAGRDRTTGRRRAWWKFVPWEIALLAVAIAVGVSNGDTSAVQVDHTVVKINPMVVMFPLLGATAALLLVGRMVGALLPNLGRTAARRRNTPYLALRRMSRSRGIVVGLVVGTALPCCLLMYGSTVTDTVNHEVTQKYQTNLGAPHVLQIYGVDGKIFDSGTVGTQVVVFKQQVQLGADTPAYVLGVDPATFARFAFTSTAQRSAVTKLTHDTITGAVPAIIANAGGVADSQSLHIGTTPILLDAVARMPVFPGMRDSSVPLIIVDQHIFNGAGGRSLVDDNVERINQFWTDFADYGAARRLVDSLGYTVLFELTSEVVVGSTGLLPVTWLFGYLRALAILIGIVAIAGLVFGLAARTRRRRVSYVLSRRMGMSKSAHLGSLLIELGIVVGLGWLAGSGLGVGSFRVVFRAFDVYPSLKPPAEFTIPELPLQITAVIAAAVVVLASAATHWLAERTRPAEILRLE